MYMQELLRKQTASISQIAISDIHHRYPLMYLLIHQLFQRWIQFPSEQSPLECQHIPLQLLIEVLPEQCMYSVQTQLWFLENKSIILSNLWKIRGNLLDYHLVNHSASMNHYPQWTQTIIINSLKFLIVLNREKGPLAVGTAPSIQSGSRIVNKVGNKTRTHWRLYLQCTKCVCTPHTVTVWNNDGRCPCCESSWGCFNSKELECNFNSGIIQDCDVYTLGTSNSGIEYELPAQGYIVTSICRCYVIMYEY